MNNSKEIELEMMLILAQNEPRDINEPTQKKNRQYQEETPIRPEGAVGEFQYNGNKWKLYLKSHSSDPSKTIASGIVEGSRFPAIMATLKKDINGNYAIWNTDKSYNDELSEEEFERGINSFLYENKIDSRRQRNLERVVPEQVDFEVPEFSKEELKLFGTQAPEIMKNIKNIKPIGTGGFRNVYDLGDHVLKVANYFNNFNTAKQVNKSEADSDIIQQFPNITLKTYKHAPDYSWIIQDKVLRVATEQDFFLLIPEYQYDPHLSSLLYGSMEDLGRPYGSKEYLSERSEEYRKNLKKFKKYSPFLQELTLFCIKTGSDTYDLIPRNFGIVKNDGIERLVILDIGTHYSSDPLWVLPT